MDRKNVNRGFKKLGVWQDAISLYVLACNIFTKFPFELKKVASNSIDVKNEDLTPMVSGNFPTHYTLVSSRSIEIFSAFLLVHMRRSIGRLLPSQNLRLAWSNFFSAKHDTIPVGHWWSGWRFDGRFQRSHCSNRRPDRYLCIMLETKDW